MGLEYRQRTVLQRLRKRSRAQSHVTPPAKIIAFMQVDQGLGMSTIQVSGKPSLQGTRDSSANTKTNNAMKTTNDRRIPWVRVFPRQSSVLAAKRNDASPRPEFSQRTSILSKPPIASPHCPRENRVSGFVLTNPEPTKTGGQHAWYTQPLMELFAKLI